MDTDFMIGGDAAETKDTPQLNDKFDKLATAFNEHLYSQKRYPLYTGGKFYTWTGTKYREETALDDMVRQFFRQKGWGQSNNVIGNVTPIVRVQAWKPDNTFGPMPFWYGPDCPFTAARNVVGFRNGLLDLGDMRFHPHNFRWCSTVALPFDHEPAATCPRWNQFLDEVFEGDAERAALLQEFMGYAMTWDIQFQKSLILNGPFRCGKGTILRVFQALTGEHYTGFSLESLVDKFGPNVLRNKLVAGVGEVELQGSKDRTRITERFKSIVGGDPIEMDEKFNPVRRSEVVYARFVIACNSIPGLKDASGALLTRYLILPFQRSFFGHEDTTLMDTLTGELSGIANWALAGLQRLRTQGRFTTPGLSDKAAKDFGNVSAPVQQFVLQRLLVNRKLNPGWLPEENLMDESPFIATTDLYTEFRAWGEEKSILNLPSEGYFVTNMKDLFAKLKRKRRNEGQKRTYGYEGLGYKLAI